MKPGAGGPIGEFVCEFCGRECADQRGLGKHRHHCHHRIEGGPAAPASSNTSSGTGLFRSSHSKSGFQGVYPHGAGQWRVEYERQHYGVYSTPEEAARVYRDLAAAQGSAAATAPAPARAAKREPSLLSGGIHDLTCDLCGREFATRQWLRRHLKQCMEAARAQLACLLASETQHDAVCCVD